MAKKRWCVFLCWMQSSGSQERERQHCIEEYCKSIGGRRRDNIRRPWRHSCPSSSSFSYEQHILSLSPCGRRSNLVEPDPAGNSTNIILWPSKALPNQTWHPKALFECQLYLRTEIRMVTNKAAVKLYGSDVTYDNVWSILNANRGKWHLCSTSVARLSLFRTLPSSPPEFTPVILLPAQTPQWTDSIVQ